MYVEFLNNRQIKCLPFDAHLVDFLNVPTKYRVTISNHTHFCLKKQLLFVTATLELYYDLTSCYWSIIYY